MYNLCLFFLMFYCYSIFGWIVECISCSINERRIIYNRGFLIGPYCPIYGMGALYMYFFITRYYDNLIVLFLMAVIGTSVLEYITSYIMEKLFNARWWDYSNVRFNINGRVCLKNAILFGVLGILFTYYMNPFFLKIVKLIPNYTLVIISAILFIPFITDYILSFTIISKLKKELISMSKDSTYEIEKKVRKILSKNKFYFRKLFRSFPKFTLKIPMGDKINIILVGTLDNFEKLRKERKLAIKKMKKELKHK